MRRITTVLLLVLSMSLFAENEMLWNNTLDGEVEWMQPLNSGNLAILYKTKLVCLNKDDGSVVWAREDLFNISKKHFKQIENSNLAVFMQDEMVLLINTINGETVFNNADHEAIRLSRHYYSKELDGVVLVLEKKKTSNVLLFDKLTGAVKWNIDLGKNATDLLRTQDNSCIKTASGNVLLTNRGICYNLNIKDQLVNWFWASKDENANKLIQSDDKSLVYVISGSVDTTAVGGGSTVTPLNIETGVAKWKELKFRGAFNKMVFEGEEIYVITSSLFSRINVSSGELITKHFYFILPGGLKHYEKTDKGYLMLTYNKLAEGKKTSVNYVDFNGKRIGSRYGKDYSYVKYMEVFEDYIFIVDESGFYHVDKTTGDFVEAKSFRSSIPIYQGVWNDTNSTFVFWENKKIKEKIKGRVIEEFHYVSYIRLYVYNKKTKSRKTLYEAKCPEGDCVNHVEIIENGYLLTSRKQVLLIDFEGNKVYSKYYKKVDPSLLASIFGHKTVYSERFEVDNSITTMTIFVTKSPEDFKSVNNYVAERNFAERTADNIAETGDNKMNVYMLYFSHIDKKTGEEYKIAIDKRNPKYIVDRETNKLYLVIENNQLQAFQL